jgi:hypothetical protein
MWDDDATVGYRPMLTLKMDGPFYLRALARWSFTPYQKFKTQGRRWSISSILAGIMTVRYGCRRQQCS